MYLHWILLITLTPSFVCEQCKAAQEELPTVQFVVGKWESQAKRIQIARFAWTNRQETPRATVAALSAIKRPKITTGFIIAETNDTLLVDREKMRFEVKGTRAAVNTDDLLDKIDQVTVFDGALFKELNSPNLGSKVPQGIETNKNKILENPDVTPILWSVMPSRKLIAIGDISSYVVTRRKHDHDDRSVIVLTEPDPEVRNNRRTELWLEPEKNFAIIRALCTNATTGDLISQLDIKYLEHPKGGWIPSAWTGVAVLGSDRGINTSFITDFDISVVPGAAEFGLDFPSNALVVDEKGRIVAEAKAGWIRTVTILVLIGLCCSAILILWRRFFGKRINTEI